MGGLYFKLKQEVGRFFVSGYLEIVLSLCADIVFLFEIIYIYYNLLIVKGISVKYYRFFNSLITKGIIIKTKYYNFLVVKGIFIFLCFIVIAVIVYSMITYITSYINIKIYLKKRKIKDCITNFSITYKSKNYEKTLLKVFLSPSSSDIEDTLHYVIPAIKHIYLFKTNSFIITWREILYIIIATSVSFSRPEYTPFAATIFILLILKVEAVKHEISNGFLYLSYIYNSASEQSLNFTIDEHLLNYIKMFKSKGSLEIILEKYKPLFSLLKHG